METRKDTSSRHRQVLVVKRQSRPDTTERRVKVGLLMQTRDAKHKLPAGSLKQRGAVSLAVLGKVPPDDWGESAPARWGTALLRSFSCLP